MDDLLNQGRYALQIVWTGAKTELGGFIICFVALAALLALIWLFWTPEVKRKADR
ncbi:MAG: hypothetical protein M1438_12290 [Deltaproteobacteria bacterium]|nr:hypothetical protein [Deltaproteobacteria bacterium]